MRKWLLPLLIVVLLGGCNLEQKTFVGFNISGKTYSSEPASLVIETDSMLLSSRTEELSFELVVGGQPEPGKTVEVKSGEIQIGQATHAVESGQFTLQALGDGLARGNFDLISKEVKIVGSFDATPLDRR